ncbi:hypothetical protein E5161_02025 [Cohnella pontilimi]|uniref:Uncharacterized protein n=1 Tax=Cohnella pontilimi TaxID=2564100 RepID=A0A4U0FIB6_9BACL|nr:glucosaminidase domain-containing protein [Cohnella pontilimi]TJY44194.1 hypothetical protein E5161_02025 [Cohnella pontilimi]
METAALLSPADVNVIRRYVQTKYAPLPNGKRAEMVADAIRRTLEQRLPDLPAEIKSRMSTDLIRRCLLSERREVKPDDVLDFCAELELPEEESEKLLVEPMLRWMNERTPGLWSADHVASRIVRSKVIPIPTPMMLQEESVADVDGPEAAEAEQAAALSEPAGIADPLQSPLKRPGFAEKLTRLPRKAWAAVAAIAAAGAITGVIVLSSFNQPSTEAPQPSPIAVPIADIGMPSHLQYRDINEEAVKAYMRSRDGLMAEEPYFSAVVASAKKHDVNPLLLFAIVGQEQGFVPRSNKNAEKIANNPFNVFHSWQEYNTDIRDSSDIAARTISRRGNARPEGHEPFDWFNKKYAEDPNWGAGVKRLFDKLSSLSPAP